MNCFSANDLSGVNPPGMCMSDSSSDDSMSFIPGCENLFCNSSVVKSGMSKIDCMFLNPLVGGMGVLVACKSCL